MRAHVTSGSNGQDRTLTDDEIVERIVKFVSVPRTYAAVRKRVQWLPPRIRDRVREAVEAAGHGAALQ